MVGLLYARPNFFFKNYSVPEDKAFERMSRAQLQQQLRYQIAPTECVVIIGGMWFNHSDWIQYELSVALEFQKPVLCVRPRGAKVLPKLLTDAADHVVNWNTESIVHGIRVLCR